MRNGDRPWQPDTGFAYVLLLLAIALISIAATTAVSLGATIARRDAELQLLAIGADIQGALNSYAGVPPAANAPVMPGRGPRSLEDLLKDPRAPGVRRHLRQLYADPLTGKSEWGLVKDSLGSITGVYSLAEGTPIKRSGFEAQRTGFDEASGYEQWVFGFAQAGVPHSR
jgi:type II secretory pathway pseudopilin PulG